MLNSAFINEQASALAIRVQKEAGNAPTAQIRLALELVTSRPASESDVQRGLKLITTLREQEHASPEVALTSFCLLALNLNEFLYLD